VDAATILPAGKAPAEEVPIDALAEIPRFPLAQLPTPLQEARNLRTALGGPERSPRILIKRDDLTGLAFGGNKVRKLEFLVADALAAGATVLVTAGAAQSNHARATAAAARVAGMRAVLILEEPLIAGPPQGNLLLDHLLGAEVRFVATGSDLNAEVDRVAADLTAAEEPAYAIPVGGSNAVGLLGYVGMAGELAAQLGDLGIAPSRLYYANGSRGTQAGIVLGARVVRATYAPLGVLVSPNSVEKEARALAITKEAARRLGLDVDLSEADMLNVDGYVGAGYAAPTDACEEAILLLARTEAIFLDPVYSGKAMAALIDHVRSGSIDPEETVVFLHTGGGPALFAHNERLAAVAVNR